MRDGIELTFTDRLDPEIAKDPESYAIEIWDYNWSQAYGSPEVKPSQPEKKVKEGDKNRDTLTVRTAQLSDDGKRVFLQVAGLIRCMQMRINYDLESADGAEITGDIHNTVNFIGGGE